MHASQVTTSNILKKEKVNTHLSKSLQLAIESEVIAYKMKKENFLYSSVNSIDMRATYPKTFLDE